MLAHTQGHSGGPGLPPQRVSAQAGLQVLLDYWGSPCMAPHPDHPWIENQFAPVYILRYPNGQDPNYFDDLARMYDAIIVWLQAGAQRHVLIADLRRLASSARGRKLASEYYARASPYEKTALLGRGYIVADDRQRHAITAVQWNAKVDIPKAFFPEEHRALVWARGLLGER